MITISVNNYILSNKILTINFSVEGGRETTSSGVVIDMSHLAFFVKKVPDYLIDLLYLSAIVYGIDRSFDRNIYSIDGWSREFDVTFKLKESQIYENNREQLNALLSFLTSDFWSTHFIPLQNDIEYPTIDIPELNNNFGQVNLFSGGMDSLIGAIDYLATDDKMKLCLTSHYDQYMKGAKHDQDELIPKFTNKYPDRFYHLPAVHIYPLQSKETTCRSRSLMFLSIALLVAKYKSVGIVVPENGPVSLNFPLSVSRRAACSTRTTHILFINQLKEILQNMGLNIPINNPYELETKGAMVRNCADRDYLLDILEYSNSCGKRTTHQFMPDNPRATHCGRCMPCMYRKASLLGYDDHTTYGITMENLFSKREEGIRNKKKEDLSNDFFAMLFYLRRNLSEGDIRRELRIAGLGKLPNIDQYVTLVQQTRDELKNLIRSEGTPEIKSFIGL